MNLKTIKYLSIVSVMLVVLTAFTGNCVWGANLELHIIDVGQGECELIVSPTGKTVLIDAGDRGKGNNTVFPYLTNLGKTGLDYTVATHYDADHIGGLDEVIENLGGSSHILSAAYDRGGAHKDNTVSFQDYVAAVGDKRTTITPGKVIDLGGGATLTCIAVGGKTANETIYTGTTENLLSVVLRLDYYDFQVYLGGDGEDIIEQAAGVLTGDVDVHKVSHHGADDASKLSFLSVITPEVSTISVGNNSYGHPSDSVYQWLYEIGSYIYQTRPGDENKIPPAAYGEVANGSFVIVSTGCSYTVSGSALQAHPYNTDGSCDCCNVGNIVLSRTHLYFGASGGAVTGAQTFSINNDGTGPLQWNITSTTGWLDFTPVNGTDSGIVTVEVDSTGLAPGTYQGSVIISAPGALNTPREVAITLTVYPANSTSAPFGDYATPVQGSVVSSSVPVTGWVLDDIEVVGVKIYNGPDFIGDAILVEGARPDVEQAYPGYPQNYRAGWGYMMLTHFLPNGGNGTYTIYAKATDTEGNQVTLGSKTIVVDNAHAVKPFGALDTPTQGGIATGSNFINWGWALTPQSNTIPINGSTINVYVDGVNLGHPKYNIYRADIAALFPGYANSNGAAGYFALDTTAYSNDVHTIQWTATDSGGNFDGIGSRYFSIRNSGHRQKADSSTVRIETVGSWNSQPIKIVRGYDRDIEPQPVYPDEQGNLTLEIHELERLEIHLEGITGLNPSIKYDGFQVVGNQLRPLPAGSTLDREKGIYYWQPGVGFYGVYRLVFISTARPELNTQVWVHIAPRHSSPRN